jgi:Flp pilus assembly protein TadG
MSFSALFSRHVLNCFCRNRRASAVVEFALVAPLFFAALFATIEVAMIFFASQVLETVTQDSARRIMTGQAQNGTVAGCTSACTPAQFKSYVCSQISVLFNCSGGIYVDVRSYSEFSSVNITPPIDSKGNFLPAMEYSPGHAGDIVVVRLFYQWPQFITGFGLNVANLKNGTRLLTATAAFKNEPY